MWLQQTEDIDDDEGQLVILVKPAQSRVDVGLKELEIQDYQQGSKELEISARESLTDLFTRKGKPTIHVHISVRPR